MKKNKKWISVLVTFMLCLIMALPAAAHPDRVVDEAGLLSDSEERSLRAMVDEISERQKVDVAVVTVQSIGNKTPMEYADDYYDYNGYGFGAKHDGVLLLVAMETRDYWMTTTGYGITALTDAGISYISERFVDKLSDGDYLEAFKCYASLSDKFITEAKNGRPYDSGHMPKDPFSPVLSFVIAAVIGAVAASIVLVVLSSQLRSVKRRQTAAEYMKKGSLNISEKSDIYLYNNITRTAIPKESSSGGGSSTHTSSSGISHGGGGGKF